MNATNEARTEGDSKGKGISTVAHKQTISVTYRETEMSLICTLQVLNLCEYSNNNDLNLNII